ncbi:hypothetical protein [Hyphococcus sp.]|jgi:hypothetical protein|uniref:hypothetical protein n=1 Tax=Hyphococcus sp. TaxID=2038636 RepID=UPI003D0EDA40
MSGNQKLWVKALFPERPSLFALFGGAVALFGDFASFLTDAVTPPALLALFGVTTAGAVFLCVRHARGVNAADSAAVKDVGNCFVCDAFRFSLCAAAIFALMMLVGGGKTATESVGEMLGLIKEDVEQISEDVGVIRESVDSITIIQNPKTDFESFNNAWIYQFVRRDSASAFDAIKKHYQNARPSKLDAAQLYFEAGRVTVSRDALIADMAALGRKNRDAGLLVIAGRNEPDMDKADALYEEARQIDPDMPFAYWDMQRTAQAPLVQGQGPAETAARLSAQKADIDTFLDKIDGRPAAEFFYLPQHQADFETIARQQSTSLAGNIASYERLLQNASDRETKLRAEKETPPPLEFEWRDNITKDLLQINKTFVAGAQRYAYRFNGGEWTESDRIPLYHEQPRQGVFELRWQDRQTGEWFGPFRYDYDAN